jgi:hypothetical protein
MYLGRYRFSYRQNTPTQFLHLNFFSCRIRLNPQHILPGEF